MTTVKSNRSTSKSQNIIYTIILVKFDLFIYFFLTLLQEKLFFFQNKISASDILNHNNKVSTVTAVISNKIELKATAEV